MPNSIRTFFTAVSAIIPRHICLALTALAFLTRLAPGRPVSDADMSASCLYYPMAGGVLGLVLATPLYFGLFSGKPWLQAWLYAVLALWLTRALHFDGLADVMDALGSGGTGEAFRTVLKDSRIGAFGVAGLLAFFSAQIIGAACCLEAGLLLPLVYAPVFGRALPIFLALAAAPNPSAGLGRLLASAPRMPAALLAATAIFAGGLLMLDRAAFLCCLFLGIALVFYFVFLAGKHGGYNGDFFGALILGGELAVLLSACATA